MLGVAAVGAWELMIFAARALASDSTEAAAADGVELSVGEGDTAVLDPDASTSLPLGLCSDAAARAGAVLLALPFVLQADSKFHSCNIQQQSTRSSPREVHYVLPTSTLCHATSSSTTAHHSLKEVCCVLHATSTFIYPMSSSKAQYSVREVCCVLQATSTLCDATSSSEAHILS